MVHTKAAANWSQSIVMMRKFSSPVAHNPETRAPVDDARSLILRSIETTSSNNTKAHHLKFKVDSSKGIHPSSSLRKIEIFGVNEIARYFREKSIAQCDSNACNLLDPVAANFNMRESCRHVALLTARSVGYDAHDSINRVDRHDHRAT